MVQMVKVVPDARSTHFVVVVCLYRNAGKIMNLHLQAIRHWTVCVQWGGIFQIRGIVKIPVRLEWRAMVIPQHALELQRPLVILVQPQVRNNRPPHLQRILALINHHHPLTIAGAPRVTDTRLVIKMVLSWNNHNTKL